MTYTGIKEYLKEEKDNHITKVHFRKFPKGNVIALFPEEKDGKYIGSYQHVGQHILTSPDKKGVSFPELIEKLEIATEKEYSSLKKELESIGYNLKVVN